MELERWGILGLGQIEGAFFLRGPCRAELAELFFNLKCRYRGSAYKRLAVLVRHGLVRVHRFGRVSQVYGLTEKGHRTLWQRRLSRLPDFLEAPALSRVDHYLAAAGAGLLVSRMLGLAVLSERELYYHYKRTSRLDSASTPHFPDLIIQAGTNQLPVEVELVQKAERRYVRLWDVYRSAGPALPILLYLAPTPARVRGLLSIARAVQARFIFALDLPTFRASLGRAWFANFEGAVWTFAEQKGGDDGS